MSEETPSGQQPRRTALVTGASSGIGAQFARALAERGFTPVLVARREERLKDLAAELEADYGVRAEELAADLGSAEGLAAVAERAAADGTGGAAPIDLLVNNAGRGDSGVFAEQPADEAEALLDLNVRALLRLTRAVLPVQIARRSGGETRHLGVINVSSFAGELPSAPGASMYSASKAFVTQWSQSVSAETAPHGVHVTAVLPGFARTEMTVSVQQSGVPGIAFVPVEQITAEALRAWAAGRAKVVPGPVYRAADGLVRAFPRSLFRAIAARTAVR